MTKIQRIVRVEIAPFERTRRKRSLVFVSVERESYVDSVLARRDRDMTRFKDAIPDAVKMAGLSGATKFDWDRGQYGFKTDKLLTDERGVPYDLHVVVDRSAAKVAQISPEELAAREADKTREKRKYVRKTDEQKAQEAQLKAQKAADREERRARKRQEEVEKAERRKQRETLRAKAERDKQKAKAAPRAAAPAAQAESRSFAPTGRRARRQETSAPSAKRSSKDNLVETVNA